MVRMKALKDFRGRPGEGNFGQDDSLVTAGPEFNVASQHRAEQLEARGLAFAVQVVKPEVIGAHSVHPDNKAAEAGPFVSVGGETGAEIAPSSSDQGRQPRQRGSRKPAGGLDL